MEWSKCLIGGSERGNERENRWCSLLNWILRIVELFMHIGGVLSFLAVETRFGVEILGLLSKDMAMYKGTEKPKTLFHVRRL